MKKLPIPAPIVLYYRPAFFCNFASSDKPNRHIDAPPIDPAPDLRGDVDDLDDDVVEIMPGHDHGRHRADGGARLKPPRPKPSRLGVGQRPGTGTVHSNGPELRPTIALWTRHPAELGYDPAGAFSIELFNTPERVAQGDIGSHEVVADDHTHNNGYTTIGPSFPHAYGAGGIYVCEAKLHEAIRRDQEARKAHGYPADPDPRLRTLIDDTVFIEFAENPTPDTDPNRLFVPRRYHGFYGQQMCPVAEGGGTLWVVWHPGTWRSKELDAQDGEQWRPPRKLWIPDAVRPQAQPFPPGHPLAARKGDDDEHVFLEQSYALYTAALDVPKQPSGSGEDGSVISLDTLKEARARADRLRGMDERGAGLDAAVVVQHGAPSCQALGAETRRNLSVISCYAPGEISRIKQKFTSDEKYLSVEEGDTLVDALSAYVGRWRARRLFPWEPSPPFDNLDLIGHSRSRDHILKIGELALTSAVARDQFTELDERGVLEALQIKAVRLLGCRTAAHPRGEKVVRAIYEATELAVYATRIDLFAVHFNERGLRPEAELLLADHDVILKSGAGDLPPSDDYPAALPDDDPDDPAGSDGQDGGAPVLAPQPPDRLSLAALSDPNASKMSACNYLWWAWRPDEFAQLVGLVYADWSEDDNPLLRADYEVLLAVSTPPVRGISDVRSFDLFVKGDRPRLRVNRGGRSYAFCFKPTVEPLCCALNRIGIRVAALGEAQSPAGHKGTAHAERE